MNKYNEFLSWVNIDSLATACNNIANAGILNESSNRMMKEKFIIGSLIKSNHANNITWADARDYDLIFNDWTEDPLIEVKTGNSPMFSPKTGKPKKFVTIKLKNVYESKTQRKTLDKEFDHLMIVQNQGFFSVGFVEYSTVLKKLRPVTDGFLVRLEHSDINIVFQKDMRAESKDWNIDLDPKNWVMDTLTKAGI